MYRKCLPITFRFNVETLPFIVFTVGLFIRQHCYVDPVGWVKVGIIVTLFGTFIAILIAIWVLPRVFTCITPKLLVCRKQPCRICIKFEC